eukprot:79267-Chlamydomonas_euryale.AAC.1
MSGDAQTLSRLESAGHRHARRTRTRDPHARPSRKNSALHNKPKVQLSKLATLDRTHNNVNTSPPTTPYACLCAPSARIVVCCLSGR